MSIHWFPGHMQTASKQLAKVMPRTDVVLEVLDARLPAASSNPRLAELRGERPVVRVLTKADLADPEVTAAWLARFRAASGAFAIALVATVAKQAREVEGLLRRAVPHRGRPDKPIRGLVAGIPNVGKSTLLNSLKGRKVARVGDEPAITQGQQRIELGPGLVLLDTPGLLWPKVEEHEVAVRIAVSGAIKDTALDEVEVGRYAIELLLELYPDRLAERYGLADLEANPDDLLLEIGRRRGCLVRGGEVDRNKAAQILLKELRSGKLGRISLERPR